MPRPVPKVSEADVERIARRDFGEAHLTLVLSLLDEISKTEKRSARVSLAVLKLAAGSMDRLLDSVQLAASDYRDVIGPAEYPSYSWFDKDPVRQQQAMEADWQQYTEWLNKA